MEDTTKEGAVAAALLRDAAGAGRLRVMLRNCSGFVEVRCDGADLILTADWLHVRGGDGHLHVSLPALVAARFLDSDAPGSPGPSIAFHGRCGSPCLVVAFDERTGPRADVYRRLRARWGGELIRFSPRARERVLH